MLDSPSASSLRNRAVRAGLWTLVNTGGSQVLRLASSLVLTRLLMPEAYGQYLLVATYTTGLVMFFDLGLNAYLLQSRSAELPAFRNAIWTIGIVRGLFLCVVGCALAWPMAQFYGDKRLLPLLMLAPIGLIVAALQSTKITLASRELRQRELAALALATQAVGVVINAVFALFFRSVWALVIGGILTDLVRAVGSHYVLPGPRDRLCWDPAVARELGRFSRWAYVSSILTFLGAQGDRLLLSRLAPLQFMGLYAVALTLAAVPLMFAQQVCQLLSPIVVQLRHRSDPDIQGKLNSARRTVLEVAGVAVALMCVVAPAFYGYLYDPRYAPAGGLVTVLTLSVWCSIVQSSASAIPLAFGDSRSTAFAMAFRLLGSVSGLLTGYQLAGVYGLMIGASLGDIFLYIASAFAARRHGANLEWGVGASMYVAIMIGSGWLTTWALCAIGLPLRTSSGVATVLAMVVALIIHRRRVGEAWSYMDHRIGISRTGASSAAMDC